MSVRCAAAAAGIGLAGVLTQRIGQGWITSAGIHFQLDDFAYSGGLTNRNAVNPETWLTPAGRAIFQDMWAGASYTGELTEPFPGNPRDVEFPVTRRWMLVRGDGASAIEFTRSSGTTNEYTYRLLDEGGRPIEKGTARSSPWVTAADADRSAALHRRHTAGTVRRRQLDAAPGRCGARSRAPGVVRRRSGLHDPVG